MKTTEFDIWYEENLVCPVDHSSLTYSDGKLISRAGREYPVVEGVPVMLLEGVTQTIPIAEASLARAKGDRNVIDRRAPDLYLESLGISEVEKEGIVNQVKTRSFSVDPVVSFIIGATCGNSYKHLIGKLKNYPIPELRLPDGNGKLFLDIGCGWGRWCISAINKGYVAVGIDPSLGAVMAGKRVAHELGLSPKYIVGDSRFLPFKDSTFDVVFSYSVLQHLTGEDVLKTLLSVARVLKPGGMSMIEMANFLGIRNLQLQVKGLFQKKQDFDVTYRDLLELKKIFDKTIGNTELEVDCFFGLGLQKSDIEYMTPQVRWIIRLSEMLRKMSKKIKPLVYLADSVYLKSMKTVT
jgi:ubiquinone/menaquinone biosynthesis C-methylase UbiE/uncharacterized protein YbaR (Trm112 family)